MTFKKIQLAWKYRSPLWRHRKLIRNRKQIIAGVSIAAAAILAAVAVRQRAMLKRGATV
jgi:hypothetical protein